MNKKQRKRREKQARHEDPNSAKVLMHGKGNKSEADHDKTRNADNSPDPRKAPVNLTRWSRIVKWADYHSPITTLILTAALVYIGTLQACIYQRQLDTARKDQRPWIKMDIDYQHIAKLQENTRTLGTAQLVNYGKTPARNVTTKIAVHKVSHNDKPNLAWDGHQVVESGNIFPGGEPGLHPSLPFGMVDESKPGGGDLTYIPISAEDVRQFNLGDIYFIVYAQVDYTDFFGVKHRTNFCTWVSDPSVKDKSFNAVDCVRYNDIDEN